MERISFPLTHTPPPSPQTFWLVGRPHGESSVDGTPTPGSTMESVATDYAMKTLYLMLMLSMPPITVASLINILSSLT